MHVLFTGELVYVLGTSPVAQLVKNPPTNAEDTRCGFDPGVGRSPGGGNGNPLQYSWLENPLDRGAWRATVPGVVKSQTRLNMHARKFHTCLSLHISVSLSITGCVSTWIPFFLCVFVYLTLQVSSLCSFISQMIPIFFFCGGGAVGNLG